MKAINIIGLCLAVIIMPVCVYFVIECERAGWSYWSDYSYGPSRADVTLQGAGISIFIVGFFLFQSIANLVKVKTTSSKVIGIISIVFMGIFFFINLAMVGSGGGATYDEGGAFNFIAGLMMIAFSIVFLVQTINYEKKLAKSADIVDDSDFN
ncbi:MAG: hypothetical protein ACI857_002305 [Arenicella sp.]|jgi:hypothetical protein